MSTDNTRDNVHEGYDVSYVQEKWLPVWDKIAPFKSGRPDDPRPKKYVLDMFPYPSGDLHMGHAEAYALGDVIARYWVQKGFNVMHPIAWDAFGLPAENAALQHKIHPEKWTLSNIENMRQELKSIGLSLDWEREVITCLPEYYKHEQKIFCDFLDASGSKNNSKFL